MKKTILITGSTDGIGLETAKMLAAQDHKILLHGRNPKKLEEAKKAVGAEVEGYIADLSNLDDVKALAKEVAEKHTKLDVLINNAGVFKTDDPITKDGLDVRFVVNAISPYLLTQKLLPLLGISARVVNLSSAAQAPVDLDALVGHSHLTESSAYAQSKLALTMWSRHLALALKNSSPAIIAVNPKSFLGSKMVKEAYGVVGDDLSIGADILVRAGLSDEFSDASGKYFDNDIGQFASPHPDALNEEKCKEVVKTIDDILSNLE